VPVSQAGLNPADPATSAQMVRRVFAKVLQEIDPDKYGLSGVISAVKKILGIEEGAVTSADQRSLVEFFGAETVSRYLLQEGPPAIVPARARVVADWFEVFMRAIRRGSNQAVIWRLGRRLGHEFVNALADRDIRT
jgi:hypothetical protein